jgi:NAD(P)-dependent dehydrogenase (short-subunit alcohol dehydrogenase family)
LKSHPMLLKDKVSVITGAASLRSIGYATAELFAEHGSKVVVVDVCMDDEVLANVRASIANKLGPQVSVHGFRCDVSNPQECDQLVRQVMELHGAIDCLVHSAGIVRSQSVMEISAQDLDTMLDVNLKGTFHICQSVLRIFIDRKAGSIVNLSSLAAQRGGGLVGGSHYAASKGGVLSLTKSIARELGHLGIRANAVCPAMIDTPMLDGLSAERLAGITNGIPLQRIGTTSEAAGACLFLSSDLAGFITGATVDVNGGSHMH